MTRRVVALLFGLLLVGALVTACGSSSSSSGGGSATPPADCRKAQDGTVEIKAKNIAWDTDCLEVSGTSLSIVEDNEDQVDHPLEIKGLPDKPKTNGKPGTEKLELTDLKPGAYDYICTIHANMTGTLYVTAGSSAGGAAPGSGPAAP
jgi:plastocyanin